MSFDLGSHVSGELVKNTVKIKDPSMQNVLLLKGYGQKFDKEFILNSYESLYLTYTKKLRIST